MLQLFVQTKARSLFKFLGASLVITSVWMILCMSVDMLGQILFLSEVTPTNITHEALEPHVKRDKVAL